MGFISTDRSSALRQHLATLVLLLVLVACECEAEWEDYREVVGQPYCAARSRDQCCLERQDDCSVPILGTLCYCDQFCLDRRENPDCCPDYKQVCLGEEPPANITENRCFFEDRYYRSGERLKINCNQCTCVDLNDHTEIQCEVDKCVVDEELLGRIKRDHWAGKSLWQPANHSIFWAHKLKQALTYKLGTLHSRRKVTSMKPLKMVPSRNLPKSFRSENKWPGLISQPDDQGWCASSWVYSTISVASDRWAIMSKGRVSEGLSFQHLLACNSRNQKGCSGGHLTRAWAFIRRFGMVSRTCYPFTGSTTRCRVPKHRNATMARCDSSPNRQPLYRVTPVYRVSEEQSIKHEIFTNGPVQATMKVDRDLFLYSRGVYTCPPRSPRDQTGFHSVRLTGWGEQTINGQQVPYWIAANSWGREWGENGWFKIRRGSNECGIEEFVLAVWADTARQPHLYNYDHNSLANDIDKNARK